MATQEQTSYEFDSIEIQSSRLGKPVEINRIVTDLEIFEHIQKPYLTARMMIVDDSNFYQDADFQGTETVVIKIRSTEEDSIQIEKRFIVNEVEKQQKVQDNAQVILFHLVEDIYYLSSLINVNRHYTGSPRDIIERIARIELGKKVSGGLGASQNMRVIVPNLTPIDAMQWIVNRASTNKGYPFYLYSQLVGDDLIMDDLGSLLTKVSMNAGKDIKFTASSTKSQNSMNLKVQRRAIKSHTFGSSENLLQIIRDGLLSSNYEVIDTLTEGTKKFTFNSRDDLFKKLVLDDILSKEQPNPPVNYDEVINDKELKEYTSGYSTLIGGSMAFRDSGEGINPFKYNEWTNSYNETKNAAAYKLRAIQTSMDAMLKKNPLMINVNGIEFLKGDNNKTIGNNIDVVFMVTHNDAADQADKEDKKKSGKYLIYSARHMFKKSVDTYDMSLGLVKIGNLRRTET